jgi:hypothetical protein
MSRINPDLTPRLLDLKQAGAYLGVSPWTVRDWVIVGALPSVRLPVVRVNCGKRDSGSTKYTLADPSDGRVRCKSVRKILLDVRDLDAFIEQNKGTGPA